MNTEHNRFTLRELGLDGLHHIYHEHLSHAFPRMERKPLSAMEKLMAAGRYEALGLYDGEELAAYALLWDDPEGGYVLLDYLAVCRDKPRGHGYGTAALRLLLDRCRDRRGLLVEAEAEEPGAEAEENALRRRRLWRPLRHAGQRPVRPGGGRGGPPAAVPLRIFALALPAVHPHPRGGLSRRPRLYRERGHSIEHPGL